MGEIHQDRSTGHTVSSSASEKCELNIQALTFGHHPVENGPEFTNGYFHVLKYNAILFYQTACLDSEDKVYKCLISTNKLWCCNLFCVPT